MKMAPADERATLVRYLLGELQEADRERIEERYMLEDGFGELLEELESELVDAYVEGGLTREQRVHFESRYLVTRERKAAVQTAYLAKVYRDRVAEPSRRAPKLAWKWPAGMNQLVSAMAAGVAIAIVGGGAWFLFDRREAKPEVRTVQNPPARAGMPVQQDARKELRMRPNGKLGEKAAGDHQSTVLREGPAIEAQAQSPAPPRVGPVKLADPPTIPPGNVVDPAVAILEPPRPAPLFGVQNGSSGKNTSLSMSKIPRSSAAASAAHGPTTAGVHGSRVPALASPSIITAGTAGSLQQKLQSEYTLTQATAAEDDIVTAGSVIVLKKGEVIMASTTTPNLYQNFYKDGKITQNSFGKIDKGLAKFSHRMGSTASTNNRTYVAGEKMWLTKIEVKDDGVVMSVLTDAVNDVRYRASVKFGWAKGVIPPVDQVDKEIAEVFSVQAADDSKGQQQTAQTGQSPAGVAAAAPASAPAAAPAAAAPSAKPVEAPPPPIAPPPPPTDAPTQTIAIGQTTNQVVGILGQPTKMFKLGAKQIYVYKDMKITFKDGRVSDVQ